VSGSLTTPRGTVYFLQSTESRRVKIGYTSNTAKGRAQDLQVGNAEELLLLAEAPGTEEDEEKLQSLFASARVRGEWFLPAEELLELTLELSSGTVTLEDYLGGVP